jgi:rhodanese-related sulfurtransferase
VNHPHHSPGFLALVDDARKRVRAFSIAEYRRRVDAGETWVLVDTREDHEWARGRLPGAIHMSKGVIERDIERTFADPATPIVCYCGGGYRSALVCDNLQRMGYTRVITLDGGYRGWVAEGLPVETEPGR